MQPLPPHGRAELVILGSGTSHGVPVVGCDCPVCLSTNPKNNRTRCSALLCQDDFNVLIDTSIDLRQQALREDIKRIDAVVYTHDHADHLLGLDELRLYNYYQQEAIPLYGPPYVLDSIRRIFNYIFDPLQEGGGIPKIELHPLSEPLEIGPFTLQPIPVYHGKLEVVAYRCGDLAYVTDVNRIPDASMEKLAGVRTLVLDALRRKPHSTHFNLEQALEVVDKIKPERACFTHMTHDMEHDETNRELPDHVTLSHDGLRLEFDPRG
jgi:phosphoribosyl 1,2-cyclic phosphate phosphodiesterase